jgi:hypothetical protein
MRNRNAYMTADMIFGILIVGIVTAVLLGSVRHERSAEIALADSRSALHLAEHALLNLQHHQPMPSVTGDMHLAIESVPDGTAPARFQWTKIIATVHGHRRALLGVVPAQSVGGKQP